MPRQKSYDRTDVLTRAMLAFWARGYEATSMAELVNATGINRGSLYADFSDKRSLYVSALRHYDQVHRKDFLTFIAESHPPKQAITAVFENAARNTGNGDTPSGCLMVNAMLELSPHDRQIREMADECLAGVEDFFCSLIEAAKRDGTIRKPLPSRPTAQTLLGLLLGLRVLTRSSPQPAMVDAITSQARALLD